MMRTFNIHKPDEKLLPAIREKIDNLTSRKGRSDG